MLCLTRGSHPVGIKEGSQITVQECIQVYKSFQQIKVPFAHIFFSGLSLICRYYKGCYSKNADPKAHKGKNPVYQTTISETSITVTLLICQLIET